jgi:galactose mutarotase-like enzyme
MERIQLRSGPLAGEIATLGAELRSFAVAGHDLLWVPDADLWADTCPVLFPVIGRIIDDTLRVGDRAYPMPPHGFAMTSRFSLVDQSPDSCTMELRSDETTRGHYPYDFALRLNYRLSQAGLTVRAEIANLGDEVMPASFGLHPGFRWPLLPDVPKEEHLLSFAEAGPIAFSRPIDRLVGPDRHDLPLEGRTLRLAPSLFEKSGIALLDLRERSLRYHTKDERAGIRITFPDMNRVMVWSRPGGDFLCIEPLLGHADPVGFAGDIHEKPGMAHIPPRTSLTLSVSIAPEFGNELG